MTEIRTLDGVSLEQLAALFAAEDKLNELLSSEGKPKDWCYDCVLPDGTACVASLPGGGGLHLQPLTISGARLTENRKFLVELKLSNGLAFEVEYASTSSELKAPESPYSAKGPLPRPKKGLLYCRDAISSRIDHALGLTDQVGSLHIKPLPISAS